jgi:hypothetical protein
MGVQLGNMFINELIELVSQSHRNPLLEQLKGAGAETPASVHLDAPPPPTGVYLVSVTMCSVDCQWPKCQPQTALFLTTWDAPPCVRPI